MKRPIASTYYHEPESELPFVIELTFDEYGVTEQRRYVDAPSWNAAIDDLDIRWEDMLRWTAKELDREAEIDPDLHPYGLHGNCWHPSQGPKSQAV